MRLLDKTFMTSDEECNAESRIADHIETCLGNLKLDTINELYVVRVTVDKMDEPEDSEDDVGNSCVRSAELISFQEIGGGVG